MQHLMLEHGKKLVAGGPLAGKPYEQVPQDRLKRAAKRYNGDPAFQKFYRAWSALRDIGDRPDPEPCAPIQANRNQMAVPPGAQAEGPPQHKLLKRILNLIVGSSLVRCVLVIFLLAFVLTPSVSSILAKTLVTFCRLSLRRLLHFLSMLFEGIVDELVYQLEHTVIESLPSGAEVRERAKASFQVFFAPFVWRFWSRCHSLGNLAPWRPCCLASTTTGVLSAPALLSQA